MIFPNYQGDNDSNWSMSTGDTTGKGGGRTTRWENKKKNTINQTTRIRSR